MMTQKSLGRWQTAWIIAALSMLPTTPVAGSIVVSIQDVTLDENGIGVVNVYAESLDSEVPASVDSFNVAVEIDQQVVAGGKVRIVSDDRIAMSRQDESYIFFEQTPFIRDTVFASDGLGLDVLDSLAFGEVTPTLSTQALLMSFTVESIPEFPLTDRDDFQVTFNRDRTVFFDAGFSQIDPASIQYRPGRLNFSAVPEPNGLVTSLLLFTVLVCTIRRRPTRE